MKKIILLLFLTGALSACNNHKPIESKKVTIPTAADDDRPDEATEPLVLNNGDKWKVDMTTNDNVSHIKTILQKFNESTYKSIMAYQKTYIELQKAINKMIVECKMKGADHDALHKWLEPLITQAAQLKNASTVPDARASLKTIQTQVNLFNQYFELGV